MAKQKLSFFDVFRFVARYWLRQPVKFAAVLFLFVASAGLETYLPTALSEFLATIRQQAAHDVVIEHLLVFLGIYLIQALLYGTTFLVYNQFETKTFQALMNDAFKHVHRLSEHFFVNTFSGSIISKINRARSKIETFQDRIIIDHFPTVMVLTGSMAFLGMQFPMLAILMTVYLVILIMVSGFFIFKISGPAQGVYADAQDSFVAHLADSIGGIATTKAYAQSQYEVSRFFDMTSKLRWHNHRAYFLGNIAGFTQRILLSGMLALLLGGGTWYLFQGKATLENMAYLAFAYTIMQSYIQRLGFHMKDLLTSSYDLHAAILLMRETPEVADQPHLPVLKIDRGAIDFENVVFTYPGKANPIFNNLSWRC